MQAALDEEKPILLRLEHKISGMSLVPRPLWLRQEFWAVPVSVPLTRPKASARFSDLVDNMGLPPKCAIRNELDWSNTFTAHN